MAIFVQVDVDAMEESVFQSALDGLSIAILNGQKLITRIQNE